MLRSVPVLSRVGQSTSRSRVALAASAAAHAAVLVLLLVVPRLGPATIAAAPDPIEVALVETVAQLLPTNPVPTPAPSPTPTPPDPLPSDPPTPEPATASALPLNQPPPPTPEPIQPALADSATEPLPPTAAPSPSLDVAVAPAPLTLARPPAAEKPRPTTLLRPPTAAQIARPRPDARAARAAASGQNEATTPSSLASQTPPLRLPSVEPLPEVSPGWRIALSSWLQAHRIYPEQARRNAEEGTVLLRFVVARDGLVLAVTIEQGSGHVRLDEAAQALLRGARLPPFTAGMSQPQTAITVPIRYRLER